MHPILLVDRLVQCTQGVRSFDDDPDCIVRIARKRCPADLAGLVRAGDEVIVTHLWNERLPALRAGCRAGEWPARLAAAYGRSLQRLARHVRRHPQLHGCVACRASLYAVRPREFVRLLEAMGFVEVPVGPERGLHRLLPLYSSLLSRALFGRGPRPRDLKRVELWLPRNGLSALGDDAE